MERPPLGGSGQVAESDFILPATNRQCPPAEIGLLDAEHTKKLRASALSDAQINLLQGWRSLPNGRMEIPYLKPDGEPECCHDGKPFRRWRLSEQEIADMKRQGERKPGKYRSPKGEGCRLYHSALAIDAGGYAERLADKNVPLRITEGELKTEAAAAHDPGRITLGLGGVNSWVDRYDGGEQSRPLVELEELLLDGREVRLCFDSDFQKPSVKAALRKLGEWLASQGAYVLVEVLPNGLDGTRLGIDDLIYRHGSAVFREIAGIARSPFKAARQKDKEAQLWAFTPEPADTRERNVYLFGLHGQNWRRSDDGEHHWQHWCGNHWESLASDEPLAATIEQFAALQSWKNRELATIRSLMAAFRRTIAQPADDAAASGLIPFRNECLRLSDLAQIAHRREHGNTWALPYDYDPQATATATQAFLGDRLGDSDSVSVLRAFGRSLLTGDRLKCFLEITGPSNTGKTVLANLLMALVGSSNTAAMTLQRLEDRRERFETLKLRNRRLAVFSECQDYSGQLQVLKAITGGDAIPAEIKGGRHLDLTYSGGVALVGNGPIRASDPTGAVINRRRSLLITRVVAAADERVLLEPDGSGGWRGELVAELPGFVNWCLAMPQADARAALARDVQSLARAETELQALLDTDPLAEWADQCLEWSGSGCLRVGGADGDVCSFLFPSYLRFLEQQGRNTRPLSLKTFKRKLVDLLRDTLGLPLPVGHSSAGDYHERGTGSVVPSLQWRSDPEANGVIRHAFLRRIGNGTERHGNGKTPVGNGWNGWNGSGQTADKEKNLPVVLSLIGEGEPESVPAVPSVPHFGSHRSVAIPDQAQSVPSGTLIEVLNPQTGEWEGGWHQIGGGKGSASVLCRDPQGQSKLKGKKEIRLADLRSSRDTQPA